MDKWYFVIDVSKCWDCNNCFIACKDEHEGNTWPGYAAPQPRREHRWIDILRTERGQFPLIDVAYRPTPCMHCGDAPCIKAGAGVVSRRADGIVLIDPERAKGRRELVQACPYGAIRWNEELDVPQKCTLCAHLLDDGWTQTRCSQACFAGALRVLRLGDRELERMVRDEGLEQLHPEWGTRPNVYYRNLYRINSAFIAGSVAIRKGEILDCAKGAKVGLYRDGERLGELEADAFGDFRFDRLPKGSGAYAIRVEHSGCEGRSIPVELGESVNLGTLIL